MKWHDETFQVKGEYNRRKISTAVAGQRLYIIRQSARFKDYVIQEVMLRNGITRLIKDTSATDTLTFDTLGDAKSHRVYQMSRCLLHSYP